MVTEKLYIASIRKPRRAGSGFDGYVILTLMRLPGEEAARKAALRDRIETTLGTADEFPDWRNPNIRELHNEKEAISGPLNFYVTEDRQYRIGQVLDRVPAGAVRLSDWKWTPESLANLDWTP